MQAPRGQALKPFTDEVLKTHPSAGYGGSVGGQMLLQVRSNVQHTVCATAATGAGPEPEPEPGGNGSWETGPGKLSTWLASALAVIQRCCGRRYCREPACSSCAWAMARHVTAVQGRCK